jgi:uncharacterized protein (DUF58 family)
LITDRPPLQPPAARQGPGALPEQMIDALDVALTRHSARTQPGDLRAAGVGAGTELSQLRLYQVGDDVRHLDAAASARTGEPHVRLHVPERTQTTWILLDVSASMAFGTAQRLKSDVAEGVTQVVGRLALRRAGALGLVRYGAPGPARITPLRAGRTALGALRHALAEGVAADGSEDEHALYDATAALGRLAQTPALVVVVSDFRSTLDPARALGPLRTRHSVLCVEVFDPRELEMPDVGHLSLIDPETGRAVRVNTSSRRTRARFAEIEAERRARLHDELRRLRIAHVPLGTDENWLLALGRALR